MSSLEQQLVTRKEASAYLRISPITLAKWSARNRHLPFVRIGGRVMYRAGDLEQFVAENLHVQSAGGPGRDEPCEAVAEEERHDR